jgi:hypothetical protein
MVLLFSIITFQEESPNDPNCYPAIMTGLLGLASELQPNPLARRAGFTIFATFLPLCVSQGRSTPDF